jgi:hypothetical protein
MCSRRDIIHVYSWNVTYYVFIYFVWHKPKIKTLLHVFDHTVKPILTYGSEVWCTFDPQKLLADKRMSLLKLDKRVK